MKRSLGALTLAMPLPVWVIGSYDQDGSPCLMTAAWCGICCSEPPCVAVALRKSRLSHANIMARRAFTVNIPPARLVAEVDYIGLVSGRDVDKFAMAGLTPAAGELADAPGIEEFPLVLECTVATVVENGSHDLIIGKIVDVKAEESVLGADGLPDMEKLNALVCSPAEKNYYTVGRCLGPAYSLGRKIGEKR